ncbi:MAG: hypothetical protein K0S27_1510 [Gammaproteobacteria bacterium]|nr:hypothetical protein [Gammaproteobacteria bacterium]
MSINYKWGVKMNSSDTLKCAEKASELVEEISRLVDEITSAKTNDDHAMSTTTRSLGEKLVKIRVYIGELVAELKWREEVSKRWKREMDRMMCVVIGMVICGIWLHFMK